MSATIHVVMSVVMLLLIVVSTLLMLLVSLHAMCKVSAVATPFTCYVLHRIPPYVPVVGDCTFVCSNKMWKQRRVHVTFVPFGIAPALPVDTPGLQSALVARNVCPSSFVAQ